MKALLARRLDWAWAYRAVEESRRPWRFRLEPSTLAQPERAAERERAYWSDCRCCRVRLAGSAAAAAEVVVTLQKQALCVLQTAVKRSKLASEQVVVSPAPDQFS